MEVDPKEMEWSNLHPCLVCENDFTPNLLRHLYSGIPEYEEIRAEIFSWNVQLNETDSNVVCTNCAQQILSFLKLKQRFLDARRGDCAELKIEVTNEPAEINNRFIYVDDLPEVYDGTPFPTPHCPMIDAVTIKKEPGVAIKIEKTEDNTAVVIKPDPETIFKSEVVNDKRLKCSICNHLSYNQESYRRHAQLHAVKDRTCPKCLKIFKNSTLSKFKNHMKLHSSFSCEKCTFFCTSKRTLDHHMKMDHTTMECGACKEVFPLRQKNAHFSRHERCGMWICMTCWQAFDTEIERAQHMLEAHGLDENEEPEIFDGFVCAGCDYTTDTEEKLRQHNLDNPTHVIRTPKIEAVIEEDAPALKLKEDIDEGEMYAVKAEENTSFEELECTTMAEDNIKAESENLVKDEFVKDEFVAMLEEYSYEDVSEGNQCTVQGEIDGMQALAINESTESCIEEQSLMDESGTHFCAECPSKFIDAQDLLDHHLLMHSTKQGYPCKICGKKFDLSIALNLHVKKHITPVEGPNQAASFS